MSRTLSHTPASPPALCTDTMSVLFDFIRDDAATLASCFLVNRAWAETLCAVVRQPPAPHRNAPLPAYVVED